MSKGSIAGEFVALVLTGARQQERDVSRILLCAGLPTDCNEPGFRLSQSQFSRLLLLLAKETNDEFWGLCQTPTPRGTFRTLCRLMFRCRTLGEAIEEGSRFYHQVVRDFVVRHHSAGSETRIWLSGKIVHDHQRNVVQGTIMFFLYHLLCWLVDRRLPVCQARFSFPQKSYLLEAAETYHGATLHFDCNYTALTIDTHWLSLPILSDEGRLAQFLTEMPSNLVRYRDTRNISGRARSILRSQLQNPPKLKDLALRLNMTPMTLSRRLQDEGHQGYREMRDRTRHEAAVELLQNVHLSLEDIAARLGFAESSAFHRAFKRWTGLSPGQYRTMSPQE
jgi:AraC-like DNA-binding protein